MLSVSIKHPDSESFIDAKMEQGKVTGANVSVKIDDEFMRAALSGEQYKQQYPIDSDNPKVEKMISAKQLWQKIIHNAVYYVKPMDGVSVPDGAPCLPFRAIDDFNS